MSSLISLMAAWFVCWLGQASSFPAAHTPLPCSGHIDLLCAIASAVSELGNEDAIRTLGTPLLCPSSVRLKWREALVGAWYSCTVFLQGSDSLPPEMKSNINCIYMFWFSERDFFLRIVLKFSKGSVAPKRLQTCNHGEGVGLWMKCQDMHLHSVLLSFNAYLLRPYSGWIVARCKDSDREMERYSLICGACIWVRETDITQFIFWLINIRR